MKRKIITAILAITVVFSAASCGTAGSKSSNIQSDTQEATVSDTRRNSTERTAETAGDTQSEETAATVKDDEKVSGSGTSKSDTSDTTASSSADSTVKKNSSDSKSSTKNSTSTAVSHKSTQSTGASTAKTDSGKKSTQSSGASNAGTKTNKAADSSTAASNTTSQSKSEHTHTWVKYVANTIQHKEEGHYETKVVKAAYDEPQYSAKVVCGCGKAFDTVEEWADHQIDDDCILGYSVKSVEVGKIHHDAETTQVWVVDKPAYTEYVYGEKCSGCGATK